MSEIVNMINDFNTIAAKSNAIAETWKAVLGENLAAQIDRSGTVCNSLKHEAELSLKARNWLSKRLGEETDASLGEGDLIDTDSFHISEYRAGLVVDQSGNIKEQNLFVFDQFKMHMLLARMVSENYAAMAEAAGRIISVYKTEFSGWDVSFRQEFVSNVQPVLDGLNNLKEITSSLVDFHNKARDSYSDAFVVATGT